MEMELDGVGPLKSVGTRGTPADGGVGPPSSVIAGGTPTDGGMGPPTDGGVGPPTDGGVGPASTPTDGKQTSSKRKRRVSGDVRGGKYHGYRPPHKKAKTHVSSTHAANNIMKFRLRGSISDPLNLEGDRLSDDCSTCAPSPVTHPLNEELIPPPLLTPHLIKDPLNLEGKVKNFPVTGVSGRGKAVAAPGHRRKPRRRTTSGSKSEDTAAMPSYPKPATPKSGKFRYGNYNRYYGYRNNGVNEEDPRLTLLRKDWLEGQACLDIGCNTGQVTIQLAKEKCPSSIVGMDIDHKLIKTAWKNLHRSYTPSLAPDGRPFPVSLTISRGPVDFPPTANTTDVVTMTTDGVSMTTDGVSMTTGSCSTVGCGQEQRGHGFPHNVQFVHGNYVPDNDVSAETQKPEFDVILALSLTKWIHLNWGDDGIKRFFKKVYHHLRPGGKFILESQPFTSYSKRKRLTAETFKNYQNICFHPEEFQDYLLSPQVGFSSHQFIGIPSNKSKGFQRPIQMYMKGNGEETSVVDDGSSGGRDSNSGRLKSVVIVSTPVPT